MRHELVFRFNSPNLEKDTYNALVKVFTKVDCKKLMKVITEYEKNNSSDNAAELAVIISPCNNI